jgi:hypothetical protein
MSPQLKLAFMCSVMRLYQSESNTVKPHALLPAGVPFDLCFRGAPAAACYFAAAWGGFIPIAVMISAAFSFTVVALATASIRLPLLNEFEALVPA